MKMGWVIFLIKKVYALLFLILRFTLSFIYANFVVAKVVLSTRVQDIHSDYVQVDISHLNLGEAILLAHCVTLTPGTISCQLDAEQGVLTVHALQADDPATVVHHIVKDFEHPIQALTR